MAGLQWERLEPYGRVSTPRRARFQLGELLGEVSEYFDFGATLERGDVVFDVGANIGAFALESAYRCESELDLYCFEPAPPIFGALEANVRANRLLSASGAHLFPHAVGTVDDAEIELSYFRYFPTDSTCDLPGKRRDFERFFEHLGERIQASITPIVPEASARSLARFVAAIPKGERGRWISDVCTGRVSFRCPTTTLSMVIREQGVQRIDLLKIDVEGAELDVLEGLEPSHFERVRQVVLEGHDHDGRQRDVLALLEARGFGTIKIGQPASALARGLPSFLAYASR